jgi:adenylyltransferase/sulfurtransferase
VALKIDESELQEERYSRLRLIPWWDQAKIAACRVLVVGAGALGNEILKNLALLGFRHVVVVDIDRIEESNLSRTVLYRKEDLGELKVTAAARAYRSILEDAIVQPLDANILYECGLGLFLWSDIVLAGLDNREARLWINRSAWKTGRPWIDGAIEGINGVARVFLPGQPPCYECTLGEIDWAILEKRMSCNLLAHRADAGGKVPTTPTISSVIAGMEVQEAVKLLHGLPTLNGEGFVFEGLNHSSYKVKYTENSECMSHYTLPRIVRLAESSEALTLEALWQRAQADLKDACAAAPAGAASSNEDAGAGEVVLEFSRDVIHRLCCPECGGERELFAPVGSVSFETGACPRDGARCVVETIHGYTGTEAWGNRSLAQLGLPLYDIFVARRGEEEIGYLPAGDAAKVLGALACEEGSNG